MTQLPLDFETPRLLAILRGYWRQWVRARKAAAYLRLKLRSGCARAGCQREKQPGNLLCVVCATDHAARCRLYRTRKASEQLTRFVSLSDVP